MWRDFALPNKERVTLKERVMKNTIKRLGIIALVAVIGFSMAACGGGAKKSGLKDNQYLGTLPALHADYELAKSAPARIKAEKKIENSSSEKRSQLREKEEKVLEEIENKFEKAIEAEWTKINDRDVPFTVSAAFQELPIQIDSVRVRSNDDYSGLLVTVTAKQDFSMRRTSDNGYRDVSSLFFKILAKNGSVISQSFTELVRETRLPKSYKEGEDIKDEGLRNPDIRLNLDFYSDHTKLADFANVEFVTRNEFFQ
jgi:uncharacterized lipoprotein YehR (DUF1307 family)